MNRAAIATRAVPKPIARPPAQIGQHVARRLAAAQGAAFDDIAADLDAADALATSNTVDQRRDEYIRQALRLVRLARRDRVNADAYLALADGHLSEAIRLDRIIASHDARARARVSTSAERGRDVVVQIDNLLTGHETEQCGRTHPMTDQLADAGVTLMACHLTPHETGPCVFLSAEGAP